MSAVLEVNDIEPLADYRLLFSALLGQTSGATFFRTLDWLSIYWKHFAAGSASSRLRTLIVYAGSRPVGVLPLVVRRVRHRFGTARALTYPLDGWGSYYGPLGKNPTATMLAAMRHIRSTPRDWDYIDLSATHTDGPDRWRTYRALRAVGYASVRETSGHTAILDPALARRHAWDVEPACTTPTQFDLGQRRHADSHVAWRSGRMKLVRYRPAGYAFGDCDPRWDLFLACRRMPTRAWLRPRATARDESPKAVEAFLRETHLAAVRSGMLDMSLLFIDEEPTAFAYGYHLGGHVSLLETGYDRRAGVDDPVRTLLGQLWLDSKARNDWRIDLGSSEQAAAVDFPIRRERIDRYVHFPKLGLRSGAARLDRWLTACATAANSDGLQTPQEQAGRGARRREGNLPAASLRLHVESDAEPAAELAAQ